MNSSPVWACAAERTCILLRPCWPEPASTEAWSAALVTSVMVRTRSREVAAISREVAPISVVVAAVSVAVACCCLEVAAISVTEVVTCTDERWAWDTSVVSSLIISLKPVSTAPKTKAAKVARGAARMKKPTEWLELWSSSGVTSRACINGASPSAISAAPVR